MSNPSNPPPPPPPPPWKPQTPHMVTKAKQKKDKDTSTQGSQAKNSKETSNAKLQSCKQDIPPTSSSRISDPASTSRDPALLPYWSDRVAEWSARLYSPIGTGFADSPTTSLNMFSNSTRRNWSWFSHSRNPPLTHLANSLRISLPSIMSTSVECKEGEPPNTGKDSKKRPCPQGSNRRKKRKKSKQLTRALKIRLYPNATQKRLLRKWVGCARLVYNMVVANFRQNNRATRQFFFRFLLKRRIEREWAFMKGVPYEVLDHAISGAITARDEVITRNRERMNAIANGLPAGGKQHRLSFLSKKDARQTITIRSQYCRTPLRFYVKLLHNKQMLAAHDDRKKDTLLKDNGQPAYPPFHHEKQRRRNNWPNAEGEVECDSKLTYDKRLRQWTFSWIHQKDVKVGETQANPTVAALDPGVVSFYTWYSPTMGSGSIATRDIERIIRLCLQLDKLIGATTAVNARKRNSYRRAQARIRQRIKDLVDEVHKKVAHWLANNFDIIVVPHFGSQRMSVRKRGRRLSNKTVRKMLTWAHGRFRERLRAKCEETGATLVTPDSEAYTSKTCSACGHIHQRLGGSRVFRCSGCNARMDRDVNAAKGILLRALACGALTAPETSVNEGFA